MPKFFIVLLILLPMGALSQPNLPDNVADSLWKDWKNTKLQDTLRIKALDDYAWEGYLYTTPDSAFYYAQLELDFINQRLKKSRYKKVLLRMKSNALNTQGTSFYLQGNMARAIDYYRKSLKIKEEIDDKQGMASTLNNIGLIYSDQKDFKRALVYLNRCLDLDKSRKDTLSTGTTLANIGRVYLSMKQSDKALKHFQQALPLLEKFEDNRSIAAVISNIGVIYSGRGELEKARKYQEQSLALRQALGDQLATSYSLSLLANVYRKKGEYQKALQLGLESMDIANKMHSKDQRKESAESLWRTYKAMKLYNKSLEMFELYITLRDSIDTEENRKEVIRQEFQYNYDKQTALDSAIFAQKAALAEARIARKDAESDKKDAELAANRREEYALFGGLALLILFAGFIYHRFRISQKQKHIIELQKKEVEVQIVRIAEAHKEITDSLHYAKRIQSAILPSPKLLEEHLPQSFVLYKPKDVVAGDFYWVDTAVDTSSNEKTVIFAAADCTGHGVPGAMVSVICNNGLKQSVRDHQLISPGNILDKTRELVIQEFEKGEEDVQDGMDIALCTLRENTLKYAGANNPLWIIRKGAGEVEETKADKQPIGKFEKQVAYTTHEYELASGDSVYVFSDGFADQFGSDKGKKFKAVQLKKLLLSIQDKTMKEQRKVLEETFNRWKGNLEQLDDVCVMGVRIP